jgi:hypothetical protein
MATADALRTSGCSRRRPHGESHLLRVAYAVAWSFACGAWPMRIDGSPYALTLTRPISAAYSGGLPR